MEVKCKICNLKGALWDTNSFVTMSPLSTFLDIDVDICDFYIPDRLETSQDATQVPAEALEMALSEIREKKISIRLASEK